MGRSSTALRHWAGSGSVGRGRGVGAETSFPPRWTDHLRPWRSLRSVEHDCGARAMGDGSLEFTSDSEGLIARIRARGASVLTNPRINRGTAFTHVEREALGLDGLLPAGVSTIDAQVRRVYGQ